MMKSAKNHLEDEEEADDYDTLAARNDSSSGEMVRTDGKCGKRKASTHRSKHSETEQRRRSKINERFQTLRDLIPQNDQKKDKASFLLEVIEYIQFLNEKLQMYEGSCQVWNQGPMPTKLTPWVEHSLDRHRNHQRPAETFRDHPQAIRTWSGHENSVVPPAPPLNMPSSMETDFNSAVFYKTLGHPPSLNSSVIPPDVVMEPNAYASVGNDVVPTEPSQEFVSDAENMIYQPQSNLWSGRPCATGSYVPSTKSEQENPRIEGDLSSLSNAYSQGVLNTLAQALQSSGVDLSQTSISVDINVGKSTNNLVIANASCSKDHENKIPSFRAEDHYYEDSNHVCKRIKSVEI